VLSSVPSPLKQARNTTLYYYRLPLYMPTISKLMRSPDVKETMLSPICRSALTVCILYMSRINEILSLKMKDVLPPDRVLCNGSKGSLSYMIYLPELSTQLDNSGLTDMESLLFPISYIKLYRACVKCGVLLNSGNGRNVPKMHAHRYIFAREVSKRVGSSDLRDFLHHRLESSQLYYLNHKEVLNGTS